MELSPDSWWVDAAHQLEKQSEGERQRNKRVGEWGTLGFCDYMRK